MAWFNFNKHLSQLHKLEKGVFDEEIDVSNSTVGGPDKDWWLRLK